MSLLAILIMTMCGGILTVLNELKVKNIIIGKQFENIEYLQEFLKIAEEKKIKINVVEEGDLIKIEKDLYFEVLWPDTSQIITENLINNNALMCKLIYKNFSMLFTGDIEEKAEKVLVSKYKGTDILKSSVLKVAHHGSSSSSSQDFLNLVQPQIALIGVGKNNLFGHPNTNVLSRLQDCGAKIYRTDENGEIVLTVKNGKSVKVNKFIK